ncbi:hypothetical protein HAZT_HAZT005792 [Hyalella azteca]|uniref:Anaphase-promoting complex subunit 4 WD40 domain-containing protein n=1 Tax=Hyalella azteca TaxID=294128 RepID=A0A6A0H4S7_HYAAZ|nr:hypothetical protein HAZT_HAZT005792 [Hyalella azteca]
MRVTLVKWNEPYQKLATCDSSGIIFVWIKHESRWSIELINDRNTPVTHFSWSHDGRMALICYQVIFKTPLPISSVPLTYIATEKFDIFIREKEAFISYEF